MGRANHLWPGVGKDRVPLGRIPAKRGRGREGLDNLRNGVGLIGLVYVRVVRDDPQCRVDEITNRNAAKSFQRLSMQGHAVCLDGHVRRPGARSSDSNPNSSKSPRSVPNTTTSPGRISPTATVSMVDTVRGEPLQLAVALQRLAHLADRHGDGLTVARPRPQSFSLPWNMCAPDQRHSIVGAGDAREVQFDRRFAFGWRRRFHPFPEEPRQDLGGTAGIVPGLAKHRRHISGGHPDRARTIHRVFKPREHVCRLGSVNRPLGSSAGRLPLTLSCRRVDIDRLGVLKPAEAVQASQPLG